MSDLAKELQMRMAATGPGGECLSLVLGSESVEQLRQMIVLLCRKCAGRQHHCQGAICSLSGLPLGSIINEVKEMSRESCLELFAQELVCRSQAEAFGRLVTTQAASGFSFAGVLPGQGQQNQNCTFGLTTKRWNNDP
jgi:hypothetical protein